MSNGTATIRLVDVSRWYGEILGVNRVTAEIRPGLTGLVGPNGSGKSTLMNVICGLLRPSQGEVRLLGQPVWNNHSVRRVLGYCTQHDHFYESFSCLEFVESMLRLHGRGGAWARRAATASLERAGMGASLNRRLRTCSKGMRQRAKIALALAHDPRVLVLDEPFNGLDPVGRREMMQLLQEYAEEERTIVLSSHILHEIEQMTDNILMMSNGYVVAEGEVGQVRDLLTEHPFQIFIRCDDPRRLGSLLVREPGVLSVELDGDRSLTLSTRAPDDFYTRLNDVILDHGIDVDIVTLADENVQSIYQYLAGREHH